MKNRSKLILAIFASIAVTGCKDDAPEFEVPRLETELFANTNEERKILIANEGQFLADNASLSVYTPQEESLENGIYRNLTGDDLGDILNSIYIEGAYLYCVVNNTSKIEVYNIVGDEHEMTITDVASPRYMAFEGDYAYISDLATSNIYKFNVSDFELEKTIAMDAPIENLLIENGYLFASSPTGKMLHKIDLSTDEIVKSLAVVNGSKSMVIDKNDKLWLLADGGWPNPETPSLQKINSNSLSLEAELEIQGYPSNLNIDVSGSNLFFVNSGVYKINVTATSIPSATFIDAPDGGSFYNLLVDGYNNDIYATNAKDFSSEGVVYRYNESGTKLDELEVGINPSNMFSYYVEE